MTKEEMLKDARTNEAMKKGYMGLGGKFSVITKQLGQPLICQGGRAFEQTYLEDPYFEEDASVLPMMEEDEQSYEIGSHFDGLSRGMNMSITVYLHLREIICRYEGRIVYKEIAGELEAFVPDPIWEEKIDTLTFITRQMEKDRRPIERAMAEQATQKKRIEILEYLRSKWGL